MTTHYLKTWPGPFAAMAAGKKTFEWRRDDRTPPFAVDDILMLHEFEPCARCFGSGRVRGDDGREAACGCPGPHGRLTGKTLEARVTYALRGAFGVPDGYVILSLAGVRPWLDQLAEDRKLVKRICDQADGMTDWEVRFVESVAKQLESGRPLTGQQRDRALQVDQERVR